MSDTLVSSNDIIESVNMEAPQINVSEKRCTGQCERMLPVTPEFFNFYFEKRRNQMTSRGKCRTCLNEDKRAGRRRLKERKAGSIVDSTQAISNDKLSTTKIIEGDDLTKYCPGCERTLSLNTEYYYHKRSGWERLCKTCRRSQEKERKQRRKIEVESINTDGGISTKCCIDCGQTFPLTNEYFTFNHTWYSKCRVCYNASLRRGRNLQKIEKARGTSDQCGSCGTDKGNILGDINDATHERYGYLCSRCYRMMLECQKDAPRMRKVLTYIELTR